MNSKVNYFTHRLRTLANDPSRKFLGEREVKTLLTVLDIEDTSKSLDGRNVIDLGCGDQHLRDAFESRGALYRGIDINECNLETDNFPIQSESIDVAVSMAVVEHIHDPGHFLAEITRVLKAGGVLWMDTPDISACGSAFWDDPTHVHPYTRSSLKTLLEISGFKDVLITPNYRCKSKRMYSGSNFSFIRARYLMPFKGTSTSIAPHFLKGACTGIFCLARKS
jgi:2-polyprenyl-3-methyl-5-hydroxy-6-metoxy-1,4-benzoquinol methylase